MYLYKIFLLKDGVYCKQYMSRCTNTRMFSHFLQVVIIFLEQEKILPTVLIILIKQTEKKLYYFLHSKISPPFGHRFRGKQ